MLGNEAPNVVSKEGFRLLMDEGYDALVICQEAAERRDNQWSGRWSVWALGGEGRGNRVLVSARGPLQPREFKTTFGLISFLQEMGFNAVTIPLDRGTRSLQMRAGTADPVDPQTGSSTAR